MTKSGEVQTAAKPKLLAFPPSRSAEQTTIEIEKGSARAKQRPLICTKKEVQENTFEKGATTMNTRKVSAKVNTASRHPSVSSSHAG